MTTQTKKDIYKQGTHSEISEYLVSFMQDYPYIDSRQGGRMAIFISSLVRVLVYLRDQGKTSLDIDVIRKHIYLDNAVALLQNNDIPQEVKDGLEQTIEVSPGYMHTDFKNPIKPSIHALKHNQSLTHDFEVLFEMLSFYYNKDKIEQAIEKENTVDKFLIFNSGDAGLIYNYIAKFLPESYGTYNSDSKFILFAILEELNTQTKHKIKTNPQNLISYLSFESINALKSKEDSKFENNIDVYLKNILPNPYHEEVVSDQTEKRHKYNIIMLSEILHMLSFGYENELRSKESQDYLFENKNAQEITTYLSSFSYQMTIDSMWYSRAQIYLTSLIKPLVYLRDKGKIKLNINTISQYLSFEKSEHLIDNDEIPYIYKQELIQYIENTPGYIRRIPENPNPQQPEAVNEQHGFIIKQFSDRFFELRAFYNKEPAYQD